MSTKRVPGVGRKKATGEPTMGLPGTADGIELGAQDEQAQPQPSSKVPVGPESDEAKQRK